MQCRKCGQQLRQLMLWAMMEDAGAHCSPSALVCSGGGEHDFLENELATLLARAGEAEPEQEASDGGAASA